MTISKRTELAREKRKLRQLEEDEPAFRTRMSSMSTAERDLAIGVFRTTLKRQRQRVSQLEAELKQE